MSVSSVSDSTSSAATNTSSTSSTSAMISPDAFLNILMTQLKYQDPLDPMETNEFMSELAQLTQVQLTQTISDNVASLVSANDAANLSQWSDIIGKSIAVDGNSVSTGDSIVVTPSGDYDSVVLTLTNSDGEKTTETLSSGDSLTLTYSGTDDVTVSASALKGSNVVSCAVEVYQPITGVKTGDDGIVAVTRNGDEHKVSTITKIIN
jgi:flagellar basal-body rod modification protein FlgD